MQAPTITNTIVDEANQRTYVVLAPTVLTDGEIYRAIRQEILSRGGRPVGQGETLTLTITSDGRKISSVAQPQLQNTPAAPTSGEKDRAASSTAPP